MRIVVISIKCTKGIHLKEGGTKDVLALVNFPILN